MKKNRIVLWGIIAAAMLNLTSCETLIRAFADQMGRNAADALWGKKAAISQILTPVQLAETGNRHGFNLPDPVLRHVKIKLKRTP